MCNCTYPLLWNICCLLSDWCQWVSQLAILPISLLMKEARQWSQSVSLLLQVNVKYLHCEYSWGNIFLFQAEAEEWTLYFGKRIICALSYSDPDYIIKGIDGVSILGLWSVQNLIQIYLGYLKAHSHILTADTDHLDCCHWACLGVKVGIWGLWSTIFFCIYITVRCCFSQGGLKLTRGGTSVRCC